MPAPDPIETILARLMPPALSESGQRSIEAMLDELAPAAPQSAAPMPMAQQARPVALRRVARFAVPLGIAATLILSLTLALRPDSQVPGPMAETASSATETDPGMVLVSASSQIKSMSDDGWMADPDGEAMEAVRFQVVDSDTFRDEETGVVVEVSNPREEMVLKPVSFF